MDFDFWPKSSRQKVGVSENGQNIDFEAYIMVLIDFSCQKIGLEYYYASVAIIWIFSNFPQKFSRSKKGVVTLSFPELKKLTNFFGGSIHLLELIQALKPE